VKLNTSSFRQFFIIVGLVSLHHLKLTGQGNCLLFPEGSGERKACELSYDAIKYRQGSKESQLLFDKAIKVGPKYAWAYYQKSVPFFKRGLFSQGTSLINKAIELEPENYLYYRAYWYFYNRSYSLSIQDLEELYSIHKVNYVTNPSGELEMRNLLGMAYALTGKPDKGVAWSEDLIASYNDQPHLLGDYDYHIAGILYYMDGQYLKAETALLKQIEIDDGFADAHYYLGKTYLKRNKHDEAMIAFANAKSRLQGNAGGYSVNFFTEFNVRLSDVEKVLKENRSNSY